MKRCRFICQSFLYRFSFPLQRTERSSLSLSLCNFRTKLPPLAGLPVPLGCRPPSAGPSFTGVLYTADLAAGSVSGDAKKRYSPALSLSLSGQICWRVFSLLNTVVIRKFFLFDFVRGLLH
jgi:hypothetical protein